MIREAVSAAPPVLAVPDPLAVCRSNDPGLAKMVRHDLSMQPRQREEWMWPDSPHEILPMTSKEIQSPDTLFETIPATASWERSCPARIDPWRSCPVPFARRDTSIPRKSRSQASRSQEGRRASMPGRELAGVKGPWTIPPGRFRPAAVPWHDPLR